ncbi:MAG: DUF2797 domain-containing protein [Bdellovibrio sp.]|nr:DUF2797 domain-containing protein [Bdellovibrio sp.]
MKHEGNVLKMQTTNGETVQYVLPIGDALVPLNPLIGKKIRINFEGRINCIATGELIKKTYGQGYCYKAYTNLPECDMCIVKPHQCHYGKGTCRDMKWGEEHCMIPFVVYLARTNHIKVGVTAANRCETRWMDQGAIEALPILRFSSRYQAGLMELEMSKSLPDKTNWQQMLLGEISDKRDLLELREELYLEFANLVDDLEGEEVESTNFYFHYLQVAQLNKVTSIDLDRKHHFEGILIGIKGQYLIFDKGVVNIRKHQGYHLSFEVINQN